MPTQFYPDGSVRQAMSPEEAQAQAANEYAAKYAANRPWQRNTMTPIMDMFGPVATGDPRVEAARAIATQTYDRNIAEGTAAARMAKPRFMYGVGNLDSPEKIDAEVLKPFREAYGIPDKPSFQPTHLQPLKTPGGGWATFDPVTGSPNQIIPDAPPKLPVAPKPVRNIKETFAATDSRPGFSKEYTQEEWDNRPVEDEAALKLLELYNTDKKEIGSGDARTAFGFSRSERLLKTAEALHKLGIDPETGKRVSALTINSATGTLTNAPTLGAPPPFAPVAVAPQTRSEYVVGRTYKGGLKYLGGDPQLQTSWQQVQ